MNLQLDSLPEPDQPGGNRVAAGLETDQAVLPDPPQVLLGDQIRLVRQAPERGPISLSPDGDDLAVGAMHLGSADRGSQASNTPSNSRIESKLRPGITWLRTMLTCRSTRRPQPGLPAAATT
jgi:hypothetical protein